MPQQLDLFAPGYDEPATGEATASSSPCWLRRRATVARDETAAAMPSPAADDATRATVQIIIGCASTWHYSRRERHERRQLLGRRLRFDRLILQLGPNLWHEPPQCRRGRYPEKG
jgi:hypothetical protein